LRLQGRVIHSSIHLFIHVFFLSGKFYGPLFYSRHDAVVLTIMKGRDYGLPDYNKARATMGLERLTSFDQFLDINPELNATAEGRQVRLFFFLSSLSEVHEIWKYSSLTNSRVRRVTRWLKG
jgi:hypothetical protein